MNKILLPGFALLFLAATATAQHNPHVRHARYRVHRTVRHARADVHVAAHHAHAEARHAHYRHVARHNRRHGHHHPY